MTVRNRNSLFALILASGAVLSLPAMAQDAKDQAATAQAQDQAAQAQEATTDTSAAAAPQAAASSGAQSWAAMDTDGDGAISKTEAQAHAGLAQVFDKADANKDSKLTPEEYRAYVAAQHK